MKSIRNIPLKAFIFLGLIGLLSLLHAQETETATSIQSSTVSLTATDIAQLPTLSDGQMTALLDMLGSTPTVAAADLPTASAGFFSLAHPEWPPLPADTSGSAAWNLSGGAYLLNDLDFNYDAPQKQSLAKGGMMRSKIWAAAGMVLTASAMLCRRTACG
jgi:hypothetical protein